MACKIAPSEGRSVKQFTDEQVDAKSDKKTDEEQASMRLFGFTDAEAHNAIARHAKTASPEPIASAWDYAPTGVWYRAFDLASSLDPERGDELVNEAKPRVHPRQGQAVTLRPRIRKISVLRRVTSRRVMCRCLKGR